MVYWFFVFFLISHIIILSISAGKRQGKSLKPRLSILMAFTLLLPIAVFVIGAINVLASLPSVIQAFLAMLIGLWLVSVTDYIFRFIENWRCFKFHPDIRYSIIWMVAGFSICTLGFYNGNNLLLGSAAFSSVGFTMCAYSHLVHMRSN